MRKKVYLFAGIVLCVLTGILVYNGMISSDRKESFEELESQMEITREEALKLVFDSQYADWDFSEVSFYEADHSLGYKMLRSWNPSNPMYVRGYDDYVINAKGDIYFIVSTVGELCDEDGTPYRTELYNEYAVNMKTGKIIPARISWKKGDWVYSDEYQREVLELDDGFISQLGGEEKVQKEIPNQDTFMDSHLWNAKFVDETAYQYIRDIYTEIDFESKFLEGDTSKYDFYKEKFWQLLNEQIPFYIADTTEKMFLSDYSEILEYDGDESFFNEKEYSYLFFDMDGDQEPELCLLNGGTPGSPAITDICIFDYDEQSDNISLWKEYNASSYYYIYGSQKIGWDRQGREQSAFYQLDENGKDKMAVFFVEDSLNGEPIWMVSLPYFIGKEQLIVPKEIEGQLFDDSGVNYFRVTEEQYLEITSIFREQREAAQAYVQNNMLTYEELFHKD